MIRIKEEYSSGYTRSELIDIINIIDDILQNSDFDSNDDYVLKFEDMISIKESIRKLRRVINAKNATC